MGKVDWDKISETTQEILGKIQGDLCNEVIPFDRYTNFSFKKPEKGVAQINICPSSIRDAANGIKYDLSFNQQNNNISAFNSLLQEIPTVQVREYQFDARMTQIFNSFSAFARGLKNGFNAVMKGKDLKDKSLKALQFVFANLQDIIGNSCTPSQNLVSIADELVIPVKSGNKVIPVKSGNKYKKPIFDIPFCLYYQIMTSKNTGKYVLPFNGTNLIDKSDNPSSSWGGGGKGGASGTSSQSILGTILNFVGANIYIPFQPIWSGAGAGNPFPQIEIKFSLFNDTEESTVNNYLFVNTIMSKNKFMQYHIFQQNPCVYDIKVDGVGRFFMCSANMSCQKKGAMRRISNSCMADLVISRNMMYSENAVRKNINYIPDIYEFTVTFESLLPNNLNNHLYRFTAEKDPIETNALSGLGSSVSKEFDNLVLSANTVSGLDKEMEQ